MSQRLRRIAARLRATAIKKVNAKSVFHMPTSPAGATKSFFCDFFGSEIIVEGGITLT